MFSLNATKNDAAEGNCDSPLSDTPWMADPFAFKSAHLRLAWMFRISAMTNIALAAVIVVLASTISYMMPLKEVRVALLRLNDKGDQIAAIEPLDRSVDSFDLVMELTAKHFVKTLLEIDELSQSARFQNAWLFASSKLYQKFADERFKAVQDAIDSGLSRSIIIESADVVSDHDGERRFAVDFEQIDERKGVEVERKMVRAYLSMTIRPYTLKSADLDERLKKNPKFIEQNPFGFVVEDIVLKEKES